MLPSASPVSSAAAVSPASPVPPASPGVDLAGNAQHGGPRGEAGERVAPRPRVRNPELPFAGLPRYWIADSQLPTHIANGVNLLFPAGERFFIRSVKHYVEHITDAQLRADIRAFFGQEGLHARAHERQVEVLREQGYDVDAFLRFYESVFTKLEAMNSPELRLSVTVALEHFTAIMAEGAFTDPDFAAAIHPLMRNLLRWHACEEIEHKAVAFDVLRAVAPSYGLRMKGLAVATVGLGAFWLLATGFFLASDAKAGRFVKRRDVQVMQARKRRIVRDVFAKGIRAYLRRDFHPMQHTADLELAREYLASVGLEPPHAVATA